MADRKVFRDHLSDKTAMRSPVETQRTIDFPLAEHTRLLDRLESMRGDIEEAHDRIAALEAERGRIGGRR